MNLFVLILACQAPPDMLLSYCCIYQPLNRKPKETSRDWIFIKCFLAGFVWALLPHTIFIICPLWKQNQEAWKIMSGDKTISQFHLLCWENVQDCMWMLSNCANCKMSFISTEMVLFLWLPLLKVSHLHTVKMFLWAAEKTD